jgi:acetate kinase
MKILVANFGSTSFKFRLFDMADERELARGGVDRVGARDARSYFQRDGATEVHEKVGRVRDQAEAFTRCLKLLAKGDAPVLEDAAELSAVGFKAVLARGFSGVHRVDKHVLKGMRAYADIAPGHNPSYIAAMKVLRKRYPDLPLVAAFESGFHETIPERNRLYGIPRDWVEEFGIRRNGFHGASHRYIAGRMQDLTGRADLRLISCHLGGSSSVCAVRGGASVANSFGFSPQSGVPHGNRIGELDPYALLALRRATGRSFKRLLRDLADSAGLEGLSGIGGDCREIELAAAAGDTSAQLAIDVLVSAVRHYVGAYLVELGGADAIAFTGGIGENSPPIRSAICRDLGWCGIELDPARNDSGKGEALVSADSSRTQVWILPTNEELVVARQAAQLLSQ